MTALGESRYRVFGSPSFAGNPVTLFEVDALDDGLALQQAAQHSRTVDNVFFRLSEDAPITARFFSSTAELWLCGHGLLALSRHLQAPGTMRTREVISPAGSWQIYGDAQEAGVLMHAQRASEITDPIHWMHKSLRSIGIGCESLYACPNDVWIVVLREMDELLRMDAKTIAQLPCGDTTPGALIAAVHLPDRRYGFRYFAPWHGKPEDSGTGSAHCYIAPLMAASREPVTALQFSPEGVAEMRVCLRDGVVALSGRVEPFT